MKTIALILMVSIVLEALVEYGKTIDKMVVSKEYKTAIIQGITIILGVGLAFIFNLQLFNKGISEFYDGLLINPTIDTILTGILFSRGSNYVNDLIDKLRQPVNNDVLEWVPIDDADDYDEDYEEVEEPVEK